MSAIIVVWLALGMLASGAWQRQWLGDIQKLPLCREDPPVIVYYREIGDDRAVILPQVLEWPCGIPLELL